MDYFLAPSDLPYELPDFASIDVDELVPAFRTAVTDHAAEIAAIVRNPEAPTWENTIEALEASGQMLSRVLAIVDCYASNMAEEAMVHVEATISPELAAHLSAIYSDSGLWERVRAIPAPATGTEDAALHGEYLRRFRRGGAELSDEDKGRLRQLDAELAELTARFGSLLHAATEDAAVWVTDSDRLRGASEQTLQALAADAEEALRAGRGPAGGEAATAGGPATAGSADPAHGPWLIRLGLPSVQPILQELEDPELRRQVHAASLGRAQGTTDEVVLSIVRLRAQRAELLGYRNHAEFVLEAQTARDLGAVEDLLRQLTPAVVAKARAEHRQLQALAAERGEQVGAADWPWWDGVARAETLASGDAELKPYFSLPNVLRDGVFYAARRLYGVEVLPRPDLQEYHPDVQVWEVRDGQGAGAGEGDTEPLGLFLTDFFSRPTKRGGAWMSSFVDQSHLLGQRAVVLNVLNIPKPGPTGGEAGGEPGAQGSPGDVPEALLTMDEVAVVFHEFGHALHGLMSDVRYPSLSGTNVPSDFVEFPSQINENWALQPEILANYARHVDTGEPLPPELAATALARARWGQGFLMTEYLSACWLDIAWHRLSSAEAAAVTDVEAFERDALRAAGIELGGLIAPRYRTAYFHHIFGGGYGSAYWSYLWAEALDADGFEAFVDTGAAQPVDAVAAGPGAAGPETLDPEDVRAAGERFRRMVLSRGASIDYEDAFWMFRGKQLSLQPLLRRRGLDSGLDSSGGLQGQAGEEKRPGAQEDGQPSGQGRPL